MTDRMPAHIAADAIASPSSPSASSYEMWCRPDRCIALHSAGSLNCLMLFVKIASKRPLASRKSGASFFPSSQAN